MSRVIGGFPEVKIASEAREDSPYLSVLIYGETGTGKTSWASRAPRPLVLSFEKQGIASVSENNPDALVVAIDTHEQYKIVWDALENGRATKVEGQSAYEVNLGGSKHVIQTLVVDSITQYTNGLKRELQGDNERQLQQQDWGKIRSRGEYMLERAAAMSVNCNVIVLARATMDIDDNGRLTASPITTPKGLADDLGGHFALVGRAGRKQGALATAHYITFAGQDRVAGKTFGNIPKTIWVTGQDGRTTLGSVLMFLNGPDAPHNEGDNAEWVEAGPPTPEDLGVETDTEEDSSNTDTNEVGDW